MDFVKLGAPYSAQYTPTELIEGYTSLIWTERFQAHGEFELKTSDVDGMKAKLPEGTFVSHLETLETMQVETHEITMEGQGADAEPVLTIKGRSATVILDHRWVEAEYQKKRKMRRKYSGTAAACVLLVNAIDNTSGADLTRGDDDPDTEGVKNHYPWTTKDALPNIAVTEAVPSEGAARWFQLEQGILYPQLRGILVDQDLGLRCVRPVLPNSVTVFTVKSTLASRGETVRTVTPNVAALRFEVYSGKDRSTGANAVQFSQLQGHIDSPQYLESNQNHKTALEVMSGIVEVSDVYRSGEGHLSGWKRKVMGFDAGSPELPSEPLKPKEPGEDATAATRKQYRKDIDKWKTKWAKWDNKRDRIVADFKEEQPIRALRELKKARRVDMFSGDISELSPYVYKKHYDLGDAVMLFGDYGKSAKMIVAEYVRTEDANGDRGIPGLVVP